MLSLNHDPSSLARSPRDVAFASFFFFLFFLFCLVSRAACFVLSFFSFRRASSCLPASLSFPATCVAVFLYLFFAVCCSVPSIWALARSPSPQCNRLCACLPLPHMPTSLKGLGALAVTSVSTAPIDGQKPGTSGLRKPTKLFMKVSRLRLFFFSFFLLYITTAVDRTPEAMKMHFRFGIHSS